MFISFFIMSTKTAKIVFWVSTIILALFILPGLFYMNSELAKEGTAHVWLASAPWLWHLAWFGQPLGILLILIPGVWKRLKEWAYVALWIVYLSALYAHAYVDGVFTSATAMPLVVFWILVASYVAWHKMNENVA